MLVSLEWLREFIDIPWSENDLIDRFDRAGIGVESRQGDVLSLEITPNRGDLLSHLGIAREVHALSGNSIRYPQGDELPRKKADLTVTVPTRLVPRYTSAILSGVTVTPTKNQTILRRLKQSGMRPVNNVVDCTNYVMLELGQPTHAFDLAKIRGKKMQVRTSKKGEKLTTLDNIERIFPEGSLVIADAERTIDLPGIMGGANSAIDAESKDIVVQAAVFDPVAIRTTSKALHLATEASYRFERGVDAEQSLIALARLVGLLRTEAGGRVEGVLDLKYAVAKPQIILSNETIRRLLGVSYQDKEVTDVLTRLGCSVVQSDGRWTVKPPSWRHDLTLEADLVEEVARILGYGTIRAVPLPPQPPPPSADYVARESFKELLVKEGWSEVMTYSLLGKSDLAIAGTSPEQAVEIVQPLSENLRYFRPSLLPGLLKAAAKNPGWDLLLLFEMGRVATKKSEIVQVGLLAAGKGAAAHVAEAKKLGLNLTKVPSQILAQYKIRKKEVFAALGDWEDIRSKVQIQKTLAMPQRFQVKAVSKFPPVIRDISMVVDRHTGTEELKMAIGDSSEYIQLVELFDEFESEKFGRGKKSLAFHVHYQHPEKTLTGPEVDRLHKNVEAMLKKSYQADIR